MAEIDGSRARQLGPHDRAVVHQLVLHDEVLGRHQHADGRNVGGVTADEGEAGIRAVEVGQLPLELAVHHSLTRDQPARRHRRAALVDGRLGRLGDGRLLVEPQIVVGGEVDELPAFVHRRGSEPAVMGAIERVLEPEHVGHAAVLVHRLEDMQLAEGNRRLVFRLHLRGADGAERLGKRARRAFEPSRRPFDGIGPRRLALARPQILVGHLVPFVSALANRTGRCVLLSRGLTVGDRLVDTALFRRGTGY